VVVAAAAAANFCLSFGWRWWLLLLSPASLLSMAWVVVAAIASF